MGFYDNYNFEGLKFFSRIENYPTVSNPCNEFLSVINYLKTTSRNITVAEIGVGFGATTLQILKLLDANDTYYCFDFEDKLKDMTEDLQARDFGIKCQVIAAGNSHDEWDSYNWHLSNMIFRMRERRESGIFDAVHLDGAHTFLHDGLAVCLLKELIKVDGFLILDDLFWNFASSEWGRSIGPGRLTERQMKDMQVLRVQELFLTNDPNFERLSAPKDYRGIFRKRRK